MNYSQTTLFSDNILLDNVPPQSYAGPIAFDCALVDEFLAELGVAPLEFNMHHPPSPEHLSTTSSLSGALGNAGSDEWTSHVAVNPGNTSHHPTNATYAHATRTFAPEPTLPFALDYSSVSPFYPLQPVPDLFPPAVAQGFYSPFPAHASHPNFITTSGLPPLPSLPHYTNNPGGTIMQRAAAIELNLFDSGLPTQPPWLPPVSNMGAASYACQSAQGHPDLNINPFSGTNSMDTMQAHFMSPTIPGVLPIAAVAHSESGQSATVLEKRVHQELDTHDDSGWEVREDVSAASGSRPRKRAKAATGFKGVAGPSKRARKSPASRNPRAINQISKSVDNDARMRIVITAQGIFRQPLGGPRVSQALAGSLGGEGLGSAEGGWVKSKATQGQDKSKLPGMEYSASGPFPVQALQEDLMPKELALLMVTQDELRCGMMTTLKCKLCPKVAFATRADFRRHCSQCEVHPDMLFSCDKCGDSFARDYARHRHSISNSKSTSQYGKCSTTTSEVIAEKRKAYHRILAGYDQDFRKWTEDGTPIGTSYAARVREEITNTSKWRTTTKEPGSSGGSTE